MNTVVRSEWSTPAPGAGVRLARIEALLCGAALIGMVALPIGDMLVRAVTRTSIAGAVEYTQHLSLWVGFLGAVAAARLGCHLSLVPPPAANSPQHSRRRCIAAVSATVAACLAIAAWQFVASEFASPVRFGGWLSVSVAASVLPLAFALIAVHCIARAGTWRDRGLALGATLLLLIVFWLVDGAALPGPVIGALVGTLIVAALAGVPIFVVLGGIALVLFYAAGIPSAALPVEAYRLVVSPSIPAIPLFTLTGFLLASGNSADRLVRLFGALFGWLPGGSAIAATLVCAFLSAFTGASGITILALGGLLLPALAAHGHRDRFAVGLITSTGSIGLLFPPSLAVILYGVVAQVPIPHLFRAAALPGLLMIGAICTFGVWHARRNTSSSTPFDAAKAKAALWESRFELLLPVVVLVALFGGFATLIEAAAISACYVLVVEVAVHRELSLRRDVPRVLVRCATLLGGVFAIIGVAMGLTNFLVDAMVPMQLVAWINTHIESRVAFLLLLNVLLLTVGCMMDIFSAIFVVLPLLIPASRLFGIDPLHLGVIFLLNLELGYLTPPVGMNLFLAAYRLERPVAEISRSVLPFIAVLGTVLLLVTFAPALIIGAE